jgi:pRiA4b ORF-3-like protein
MPREASVHRLKVTIAGIRPPIWRRIEVDSDSTLADLHQHLQTAFGWWDYHLHEFRIGGTVYGIDDGEDDEPPIDETTVTLRRVAAVSSAFTYVYDFGDDWVHQVKVEAVEPADPRAAYPRCLAGRRTAPPEDVGGTWGYASFCEAIADPKHPEHRAMKAWVSRDFDPDYFAVENVNEAFIVWLRGARSR